MFLRSTPENVYIQETKILISSQKPYGVTTCWNRISKLILMSGLIKGCGEEIKKKCHKCIILTCFSRAPFLQNIHKPKNLRIMLFVSV